MKNLNWSKISKYLLAFFVPTLLVLLLNPNIDNDSWDVLAQGRHIVENGIYHEDVLSMHEGLHAVVQNYAFSVVFYLIHSVFGVPGIYISMLILNFLVIWLLYKISMLLSQKNTTLSLLIAAATDSVMTFGFIVTRAQMLDYVVFLILIYLLELFLESKKSKKESKTFKYLWFVPLLSLFLANFHASVWWIIFAIMIAYGIEMLINQKFSREKYHWKTFCGVFVVSVLVGAINPYGIEMITFIFKGYQGLAGLDFVMELQSFNPLSGNNLVFYMGLLAAISLFVYGKRKIRLRHLLIFFGFLTMGLSSMKGMSELLLIMFVPLAFIYQDFKFPQLLDVKRIGKAASIWSAICVVITTFAVAIVVVSSIPNYPNLDMKEIMDLVDEKSEGKNKEDLKIYVGYNQGGYIEYRGYHAYLDPRGGDFIKSINGKEDIMSEWLELIYDPSKTADFLSKYDFDFLVTESGDIRDDKIGDNYQKIYDKEDSVYKLYEKVENN